MRWLLAVILVLAAVACGGQQRDGAVLAADDPATTTTATTADPAALDVFVDLATRHGTFGPFPLPPFLADASDVLPTVEWHIEESAGDGQPPPNGAVAVLSTEPRLGVVARIGGVVPLRGRYAQPDGDISYPVIVEPTDERAEELFVGLELTDIDVIAGDPHDEPVRAGLMIDVDELDDLVEAVAALPPMFWALGTAEHTLFDPVADLGVFNPVFPWFAVIDGDGNLSFPMLEDDTAFTATSGTIDALRREAEGPRTIAVTFVTERDDYVQIDDGRRGDD